MSRALKAALAVTAILATGLLLLADSAESCTHPASSATFLATGDCGSGVSRLVTVSSSANSCTVSLSADIGLPLEAETGAGFNPHHADWDTQGEVWLLGDGGRQVHADSPISDGGSAGNDAGELNDSGAPATAAALTEVEALCKTSELDGGGGVLIVTCTPEGTDGPAFCTETLTPQ